MAVSDRTQCDCFCVGSTGVHSLLLAKRQMQQEVAQLTSMAFLLKSRVTAGQCQEACLSRSNPCSLLCSLFAPHWVVQNLEPAGRRPLLITGRPPFNLRYSRSDPRQSRACLSLWGCAGSLEKVCLFLWHVLCHTGRSRPCLARRYRLNVEAARDGCLI